MKTILSREPVHLSADLGFAAQLRAIDQEQHNRTRACVLCRAALGCAKLCQVVPAILVGLELAQKARTLEAVLIELPTPKYND